MLVTSLEVIENASAIILTETLAEEEQQSYYGLARTQVMHKKHHLEYDWRVRRNVKLRKETDDVTRFRCAGGIGLLREQVWTNTKNEVEKYNPAFLLPHAFAKDNGRVLGDDNAHRVHERPYPKERGEKFRLRIICLPQLVSRER